MLRVVKAFWKDERGVALILVSIMLPVIVGFALLAIDMSRANNLHNDLQKGADAFALAAAVELDGRADAWERAQNALATLVDNTSRFSTAGFTTLASTGGATVDPDAAACRSRGHISWCFLKDIPDADSDAVTSDNYAANTAETAFIQVRVIPTGFAAIFPASFLSAEASNSFEIGATAVAGFRSSICEVTPMWMCNPFEADGMSLQEAFAAGLTYSRELRLLKVESNPGPGNFGLLDTDIPLREAFAKGTPGTCYVKTAVETKTGVTLGHVNSGLNVRFDIYSGSLKSFDANPAYRPAKNVRKGAEKSSNCNKFSSTDDPLEAMGFPPGENYSSTLGMSDAGWDRDGYWGVNHPPYGDPMPSIPSASHPTSDSVPPSRYDVYKYELGNGLVADEAYNNNKPNGETGNPQCYTGESSTLTNDPDRRLFNVAVVNCIADLDKINGHLTGLRPDSYASVFLTNPVEKEDKSKDDDDESANEKPIRLEIVDVEGPLGNGTLDDFLRDEVQLYR
jgi:Flp pilus assembly protein TadG